MNDLVPITKAIKKFVPRKKAVEEKQGLCIKMLFGLMFYIKTALYMCFLVFYVFFTFSYRHIFETLKKPLYFSDFYSFDCMFLSCHVRVSE